MELKPMDFYCERTDASFWSEPWNAWSNLSFVIAGILSLMLWLKYRRQNPRQVRTRPLILSCLLILVGVGSFLFHTFADSLTYWGDLIPIFILTSTYLYHSAKRFLGYSALTSSLLLIGCIGAMLVIETQVPKAILNGSTLYLPPLALLFFFGWSMRKLSNPRWSRMYLSASFVFLISLSLRTLDMSVCESFPLGTHFLWHSLNGVFLGILLHLALQFDRENLVS